MNARVRQATEECSARGAGRAASLKLLVVAGLLLSAAPARPNPSNGIPTEFRPSLPVFGGGRFVNFLDGDDRALTNAAAHTGFSVAIPLFGEHFWGRKGLWIAGLSWMALSAAEESLFHAPPNPGRGYPAEVRADLLTRLVPCATLLLFDALRGGAHPDMRPSIAPERPGMPWPMGLEIPRPAEEAEQGSDLAALSGNGGSGGQAPAGLEAAAPTECTAALLFQGSAACSWEAGRPPGSRQLAAR